MNWELIGFIVIEMIVIVFLYYFLGNKKENKYEENEENYMWMKSAEKTGVIRKKEYPSKTPKTTD